jgi:hypothetical protein
MLARSARLYYKYYHSKEVGTGMHAITMKSSDAEELRPAPDGVANAPGDLLDDPDRAGPKPSRRQPNRDSLV